MMIFLANHDAARIGDVFEGHPEKLKLGMTMLATLRGIPQLFYGDEMMFMTGNPRRDDGRLRMDFPGGWPGDKLNLFTEEGRKADKQAAEMHDYCRTLFQWRKGKDVIHSGKTLHFLPEKNTYGYFPTFHPGSSSTRRCGRKPKRPSTGCWRFCLEDRGRTFRRGGFLGRRRAAEIAGT